MKDIGSQYDQNDTFNKKDREHQSKYHLKLAACFFGVIFCIACHKKSAEKTMEQYAIIPFQISISTGGGFTGLSTGYMLSHDGRVEHWQRFAGGEDTALWSQQSSATKIMAFKMQLDDLGMLGKQIQESGNMTTMVTLELPDTTYTWYWGQHKKTELTGWAQDVESFCQQLKKLNKPK